LSVGKLHRVIYRAGKCRQLRQHRDCAAGLHNR
jgi:hypothetical protein